MKRSESSLWRPGFLRTSHRTFRWKRRGWTRFAARLGLWALMIQVLVPLGQGIPVAVAANGHVQTLVICSAYGGVRTIPVPGAASGSGSNTAAVPGAAQSFCPVCAAYAVGGHLTVPILTGLPLPRMAVLAEVGLRTAEAPVRATRSRPRVRDPPVQV